MVKQSIPKKQERSRTAIALKEIKNNQRERTNNVISQKCCLNPKIQKYCSEQLNKYKPLYGIFSLSFFSNPVYTRNIGLN